MKALQFLSLALFAFVLGACSTDSAIVETTGELESRAVASEVYFRVNPTYYNSPAQGGRVTFTIESNAEWDVAQNPWGTTALSTTSGRGNGTVTAYFSTNNSTSETAVLRFEYLDGDDDAEYYNIPITQPIIGNYTIQFTPSLGTTVRNGSTYTMRMPAGQRWEVGEVSEGVSVSPTRGNGGETAMLYINGTGIGSFLIHDPGTSAQKTLVERYFRIY